MKNEKKERPFLNESSSPLLTTQEHKTFDSKKNYIRINVAMKLRLTMDVFDIFYLKNI